MGEPVSSEAVNDSVRIAELVVKAGTDDAVRQCATDIADALAHVIPDVGHLAPPGRLFKVDEDGRESGTGVAANIVQVGRLLKLALESLSDLLNGISQGRSGPGGLNDHRLDRESRVLVAAQTIVSHQSRNNCRDHEINNKRAVL